MLRKSNLLVKSARSFDASQQLLRSDFTFYSWGGLVTIRWSKTIQFRERVVRLPLSFVAHSPLSPVTAVTRAMHFTRQASPDSQDFAFLRSPDLVLMHVSYPFFLKKLRAILSAIELSAKDYACHSFRRGGASFAVQSGVPVELIKLLDAVLLTLRSLFLLDCNLLIPSISPFSLQTIFSSTTSTIWVWSVTSFITCFILILYLYLSDCLFTCCNKGCHSPNPICVMVGI